MLVANYQDFDLDFKIHPLEGDLMVVKEEDAISQAIKNLVLTNKYEVPYQSNKAGRVLESLFENFDPVILEQLRQNVKRVVLNYEPRATDIEVLVAKHPEIIQKKNSLYSYTEESAMQLDRNEIAIQVYYRPINSTQTTSVIIIKKIR